MSIGMMSLGMDPSSSSSSSYASLYSPSPPPPPSFFVKSEPMSPTPPDSSYSSFYSSYSNSIISSSPPPPPPPRPVVSSSTYSNGNSHLLSNSSSSSSSYSSSSSSSIVHHPPLSGLISSSVVPSSSSSSSSSAAVKREPIFSAASSAVVSSTSLSASSSSPSSSSVFKSPSSIVKPSPSSSSSSVVKSQPSSVPKSIVKAEASLFELTVQCPDCKDSEVIEDRRRGINVCSECGMVIGGQIISEDSEWRSFADDDKGDQANRVGGPEGGLLDMGLSTVIGKDKDGNASVLSKHQNKTAMGANIKQLLDAFKRAQRFASSLSLPPTIVDRCNELYKRLEESKQFKSRGLDVVVTTCLYIVCKQEGVPRTFKELCAVADVKTKDVGRCFNKVKKLKMYKKTVGTGAKTGLAGSGSSFSSSSCSSSSSSGSNSSGSEAISMLDRFCSVLKLPLSVVNACAHVVSSCVDLNVVDGRAPASLAAVAIYLITQLTSEYKRTLDQIAAVSHISASTIKSTYKIVWNRKHEIVPTKFANAEQINALQPP